MSSLFLLRVRLQLIGTGTEVIPITIHFIFVTASFNKDSITVSYTKILTLSKLIDRYFKNISIAI